MSQSSKRTKYIFITGGVTSSLGKGITAASLGNLLQSRQFNITVQKFDPYLNIDPGTLNPYEHGECFVTRDGAETDLDLGHYERFLNIETLRVNNVTSGQIYSHVISEERKGRFLGKTVQVIPHITDEIKRRIVSLEDDGYDIIITEIGGTIGDIESLPYIEAIRQFIWERKEDCCVIHLTLVPFLKASEELKTKPTQHSVKSLLSTGVQPDILVCRTEHTLGDGIKQKIANFCNITFSSVIEAIDVNTIYAVPFLMLQEKLDVEVLKCLNIDTYAEPKMDKWKAYLDVFNDNTRPVYKIAIIGKYIELKDSYKSIIESITHASISINIAVDIQWVSAESILDIEDLKQTFLGVCGVIVAPGFGERGLEGKIKAIQYVREHNIPFFGICFGMQSALIEIARNVVGLKGANTLEANPDTPHPVINIMEEQKTKHIKGGTMRLGNYSCVLDKDSKVYEIYEKNVCIEERHRHRFEVNNAYKQQFEECGVLFSGLSEQNGLVEIMELKDHLWFVGVQFHPEYKSKVLNPHPLFVHFLKSVITYSSITD